MGQGGTQLTRTRAAHEGALTDYSVGVRAGVSLAIAIAPTFMIGAVALPLRADLGLSRARLGVTVAVFMAIALITAPAAGRLVDRRGGAAAMRAGLIAVCLGSLCVGLIGDTPARLTLGVIVCGVGLSLVDAAANLSVARRVRQRRQAMSFGIKELGGPAATVVCGVVAVPLAGQGMWRPVFLGLAVTSVCWMLALRRTSRWEPRGQVPSPHDGAIDRSLWWTALLGLGLGLGVGCATSVTTYAVDFAESVGVGGDTAGRLLAGASVGVVIARLLVAYLVSRREALGVALIPVMLAVGGAGHLVFAASTEAATVIGILLALVFGYGWGGALFLFVVRMYPERTGRAGGIVFMGAYAGAVVGTPTFGWIVDHYGFTTAWHVSACTALVAATSLGFTLAVSLRDPMPKPRRG